VPQGFAGPPPASQVRLPPRSASRPPGALVAVVLLVPFLVATIGLSLAVVTGLSGSDPRDGSPASGPGGASPGSYVEARVQPGGDIVVRQQISTEEPVRELVISVPELAPGASVGGTRVRVLAQGVPVAGPARIQRAGATYVFAPSTDLVVTYRVVGALHLSDSVPGRALAVTTTLDVSYAGRPERETRVVAAPEVLSLACVGSVQETPEPCGTAQGPGRWQVELVGEDVTDRVIAQLDLPPEPGAG
jgi:hypothetical protein